MDCYLFYLSVWEKVICEWEKKLTMKRFWNQVHIGESNNGVRINCLAFADILAILSRNIDTTIVQINTIRTSWKGQSQGFFKTRYST